MFEIYILVHSLVMQATGNPVVTDIVAIVAAVGSMAGVIGAFLTMFSKFKNQGQLLTAFSQKTAEQEGNIAAVGNAILTISPEAEKELAKAGVPIAEIRRRVEVANEQFKILKEKLPAREQADTKKDLPR